MSQKPHKVESEGDAEDIISAQLRDLKWPKGQILRKSTNPSMREYLGRDIPDYTLSDSESGKIMAVIEAKRRGSSLEKALTQGLSYAQRLTKLGCFAVFASDGTVTRAVHVNSGKSLIFNGEEVKSLLSEKILTNFSDSRVFSRGESIKGSTNLISIFKEASKFLQDDGLVNIDAFAEFSQVLFIKIISELYDDDHERPKPHIHWRDLANKHGEQLMRNYKDALLHLADKYSGMFGSTQIKSLSTLEKMVREMDKHSFIDTDADIKGDAYEYFMRRYIKGRSPLSQYFTPRHVVNAMVILSNPRWRETVCDPFCGTGGMLIHAFKHIERIYFPSNPTSEDINRLQEKTIFGADISRSADAAKMNMILAGDGHSNIRCTNSLRDPSDDKHDIVITNIPFGADEIQCIRHCMDKVDKKSNAGRLCIIVPERVLDSMQSEYIEIRSLLLENWEIRRVVSLPREVFRGLTSAKTSIIYALYKGKNSKRARIAIPYFEVVNDGYTLDSKRDPLPGNNDLDVLLEDRHTGEKCIKHISTEESGWVLKPPSDAERMSFRHPEFPLSTVISVKKRPVQITGDMICREMKLNADNHEIALKEERYGYNVRTSQRYEIHPGDLVFARMHTQNGLFAISNDYYHCTDTRLVCEIDKSKIDIDYLCLVLEVVIPTLSMMDTTGRENYKAEQILSLPIPLPSLGKQQVIVADAKKCRESLRRAQEKFAKAKDDFCKKICR